MPADTGTGEARISIAETDIRTLQANLKDLTDRVASNHLDTMEAIGEIRSDLRAQGVVWSLFDRLGTAIISSGVGGVVALVISRVHL